MAISDSKLDANLLRLNKLDTLDNLVSKLDALAVTVSNLSSVVEAVRKEVDNNTQDIKNIRSDFETFKRDSASELRAVKNTLNYREQQLRGNTVRLFNFPHSQDDAAGLQARVYDRIVRPLLSAAKAAGDLASVPQAHNAFEACYRAFSQEEPSEGSPPAPVVIRFVSKALKIAVLKNRRQHLPEPSEGERRAGVKRFVLVEDLTPPAHKLLKVMQADSRTDKVWSVNGQICFSVPNKKGFKKVRSVFDSLDLILS